MYFLFGVTLTPFLNASLTDE